MHVYFAGFICHTTKRRVLTLALPLWAKDANLACTFMYHHLRYLQSQPTRSPVLFVQADNCAAENKCHEVLGFYALLIVKKWYRKVILSYMPAGHGHNDADAFFGVMWRWLDSESLLDLDTLVSTLTQAYGDPSKKPHVQFLFVCAEKTTWGRGVLTRWGGPESRIPWMDP